MIQLFTGYYNSPIGLIKIQCSDAAVCSVKFSGTNAAVSQHRHPLLEQSNLQLQEYFAGTRKMFELPIEQNGSPFQQKIWKLLEGVHYGSSLSYKQLARLHGDPKAIRAVAAANGKNNIWIIMPCHRIVGSNGALTGYAGGIWRKQWLLDHEAKHSGKQQLQIDWTAVPAND